MLDLFYAESFWDSLKICKLNTFRDYLTDTSRIIYDRDMKVKAITIIECTTCGGAKFLSGTLGHEDHDVRLRTPTVQNCAKTVYLDENGKCDEKDVKAFADTFNRLAAERMIDYGMVGSAIMWETHEEVGSRMRAILLFYVFSDYSQEQLNSFLRNDVFVGEGEVGNDDWTNLLPKNS